MSTPATSPLLLVAFREALLFVQNMASHNSPELLHRFNKMLSPNFPLGKLPLAIPLMSCRGPGEADSSDEPPSDTIAMERYIVLNILRRKESSDKEGGYEMLPLVPQQVSLLRSCLEAIYIAMPAEFCRFLVREDGVPTPAALSMEALLRHELADATARGEVVDAVELFADEDGAGGCLDPNMRWWQGDMSRLKVDAMVNPANCAMLGCFKPGHRCLDNILHCKSGPLLRLSCLRELEASHVDGVPNGGCVATPAFCLPASFVYHTVGPCLFDDIDLAAGGATGGKGKRGRGGGMRRPTEVDRQELASCYRSCLTQAFNDQIGTIAFCCISTGVFGYPQDEAAIIAIHTVRTFLAEKRAEIVADNAEPPQQVRILPKVVFNVFKDEDRDQYTSLLQKTQI